MSAENMTLRARVERQELEKIRGKIDRVLAYMDELEKNWKTLIGSSIDRYV